jgi:hypothetical protein
MEINLFAEEEKTLVGFLKPCFHKLGKISQSSTNEVYWTLKAYPF